MSKKVKVRKTMRGVLGHDEGLHRKGEWAVGKVASERGKDKGLRGRGLNPETTLAAAKELAGGATMEYLTKKYGVANTYLREALRRLYITSKTGRNILRGLLLENGISAAMRVKETIGELDPMQAAVTAGIMTKNYIDLDEHINSQPTGVDAGQLTEVNQDIDELVALLDENSEQERKAPKVIDIESEVVGKKKKK